MKTEHYNQHETVSLDKDDFRSTADGYHFDMWKVILKKLKLPPNTISITIWTDTVDYYIKD